MGFSGAETRRRSEIYVGVDLAIARPSAIAVLEGCELYFYALAEADDEIKRIAELAKPDVIAIDAPLSRPERGVREIEKRLAAKGFRLLPPLMGPMAQLTNRGIELAKSLAEIAEVIEIHPTTSAKSMGIKKEDVSRKYRVKDKDVVDAIIAALTAIAYKAGEYEKFENFVLPLKSVCL